MWQEQEIHDCVSAFDPLVANLDSVALPLKKMRAAKLKPKPKAQGKAKAKTAEKAKK